MGTPYPTLECVHLYVVVYYTFIFRQHEEIIMINLTLPTDVIKDKETLGGGGNSRTWESGVYNATVEMVTIEESSGGATAVNLTLKNANPDAKVFPLRETFWITSGREKGQNPFYVDREGKKHPLPGYTAADRLCIAVEGKPLTEVVPTGEKKTINAYSYEQKKEVPTEKFVLTSLLNKPVQVAVQLISKNKRAKSANGAYEDIAETVEVNEIRYFANAESGLSVSEIIDGVTEATFMKEWDTKFKGQVIDKTNKNLKAASSPDTTDTAKASVFS